MTKRLNILGISVDNLSLAQTSELIIGWVKERRLDPQAPQRFVVTANPEYIMAAYRNPTFLNLVNSADLVTADGIGIILAGKILAKPFQARVTGVALAEKLFSQSAQHSLRLFLLGATEGTAELAAAKLKEEYPGILIVGTFAGSPDTKDDQAAVERIQASQADIIMVAYGIGKQDWWTARNLKKSGASVAIGIGGVLDYKAGIIPLASERVRRLGLEWAYRLYREPWRWRRQLALPRFAAHVILHRFQKHGSE